MDDVAVLEAEVIVACEYAKVCIENVVLIHRKQHSGRHRNESHSPDDRTHLNTHIRADHNDARYQRTRHQHCSDQSSPHTLSITARYSDDRT